MSRFSPTLLLLLLFSINLSAQEESHSPWRLGLVLGHSWVPSGKLVPGQSTFLVVPSWGVEAAYDFSEKWGITWANEIILQEFIVVNDNVGALERVYPFVSALEVVYHTPSGFSFFAGPGVELEKNHNFFIIRLGAEYHVEIENGWAFFPTLSVENRQGKFSIWALGFGISKRFLRKE